MDSNVSTLNDLRLIDEERRIYEFVKKDKHSAEEGETDPERLMRIYNTLAFLYFVIKEKKYPLPRKEWVKMHIAKNPEFARGSQPFRKDFATYFKIIRSFFADKQTGPTPFEMIGKYKLTANALYNDPVLIRKKIVVNFASGKRFIKNRLTPTEVKKIQKLTGFNYPNRDTMSYLLWCVQKTQK